MITEVYINGDIIDIDQDDVVTASYGNISYGELSKRKGVKSNTWKAPFSLRNKFVFESCEVPGSYSLMPYRKGIIVVKISGVIVFEGFCTLTEAEDSYQIQSFAGASDFYSIINGIKLDQLDLSQFNHVWDEGRIRNSWTNTQGYIYAHVYYGKDLTPNKTPPEYLLPQVFFHTVIKQIATDAGYTLSGDVLTLDKFLKHVIVANKFPLPIIYGGNMVLNYVLPDVLQSKVWLDFANIYGLQFDIDDTEKTIQANYIDDLLFNDSEDWTSKVDRSDRVNTKYSLGYAQKSYLRYNSDDVCIEDLAKEVLIDDQTLAEEVDIYKSEFFIGQSMPFSNWINTNTYTIKENETPANIWNTGAYTTGQNVFWNGTYYEALSNHFDEEPPNETYWKVKKESDIWSTKSRAMYGILMTDITSPFYVEFSATNEQIRKRIVRDGLGWEDIYSERYRVFSRIIERTKIIRPSIKLNYADINQLDFTRLKRIEGELYLLEEVTQFKLNKPDSTFVNLIRL